MGSEGQEALQEARIELQKLKARERKLAEENRVILSTISAISKASNISEIFYSLEFVLKIHLNNTSITLPAKALKLPVFLVPNARVGHA